ncbi:hypothetical protein EZY14_018985 [Kordia sp. TARA_039_SRF]|nr:hypothetical protein EZY14_018985 [Kordia sp. TARA_039_SRF]
MAYPRDFIFENRNIEENTAFVIIPFNEEMSFIYGEILQVCIELKISCIRADEIFDNRSVMGNILDEISSSEVIIADLSQKNPNVYYELGIAHSIRDENSVLLLTDSIEQIPFDIKNRSILIYNRNNIHKFKNDLRKKIQTNRYSIRKKLFFKTFLLNNGISENETESFIKISRKLSKTKIEIVYNILKKEKKDYSENDINSLYVYFSQLREYNNGVIRDSVNIFKMLVFTSDIILNKYNSVLNNILIKSNNDLIHVDDEDTFSFASEYCFKIIDKNLHKTKAINWLLNYLKNYKMGRIDLVRSKIESFLVKTNDSDVNLSLLNTINSDNITLREAIVDICGQKRLKSAIPYIIETLKLEKNPHVARSCITSLARMKATESINAIFNWMISNNDKWGDNPVSGSLKSVALTALMDLDEKGHLLNNFKRIIND